MTPRPFISVVLAVRNESRFIQSTLLKILNQDYGTENYEIIVADGMSADDTRAVIEELQKKYANLRLIENPKQIVAAGLNELMKHARGNIIARVDGHCEISSDYLSRAVELLEQYPEAAGVGGPIETVGQDFISKAVAVAMSSNFGVGGSAFRTLKDKEMYADTIPFPVYRREVLEKAGPYDEELVRNQDDEYNYRLRKMGYKVLLSPKLKSIYYGRASLGKLFSQYFQYGYWKVRVLQKHPAQTQFRQYVPFLFVFYLSIMLVSSFHDPFARAIAFFLIFCYMLANILASAAGALKNGPAYFFILPAVYAALHFGYGYGFLAGIVRFAGRWGKSR